MADDLVKSIARAGGFEASFQLWDEIGDIDLAERLPRPADDAPFGRDTLVKLSGGASVFCEVIASADEIALVMSASQVENPDTERAFHAKLRYPLSWDELEALSNFLSMLLHGPRTIDE